MGEARSHARYFHVSAVCYMQDNGPYLAPTPIVEKPGCTFERKNGWRRLIDHKKNQFVRAPLPGLPGPGVRS